MPMETKVNQANTPKRANMVESLGKVSAVDYQKITRTTIKVDPEMLSGTKVRKVSLANLVNMAQ